MQTPSVTIEAAAEQFKVWRQSKKRQFDPMPDHLKQLVKQLAPHYSRAQLAKNFNLNAATIRSYCSDDDLIHTIDPTEQNINFIPFQIGASSSSTDKNQNKPLTLPRQDQSVCQIIKPNGNKLIIQTADLKSIIQAFICCN